MEWILLLIVICVIGFMIYKNKPGNSKGVGVAQPEVKEPKGKEGDVTN